jgi:RNase P/RNase MRP subunit POP5
MRPKRRYIVFEVLDAKLSRTEVTRAILNSLRDSDFTHADIVRLILYNSGSGRGLLRCGHKQVGQVKAVMARLKQVGEKKAFLKVLGVSGTIRVAKRKFLPAL